jgi:hypothetical protein
MKRFVGWLFTCGGALVAVGSVALRHPSFIIINGRYVGEAWLMQLLIGIAFSILGILIVRRTA